MTDLSAEERAQVLCDLMYQHGGLIIDPSHDSAKGLLAIEAAAIERACQRIEAVVERGYPTPADKTDRCAHGMFGWEDCIACYDEQILAEVAAIRQLHSGEGAGDQR